MSGTPDIPVRTPHDGGVPWSSARYLDIEYYKLRQRWASELVLISQRAPYYRRVNQLLDYSAVMRLLKRGYWLGIEFLAEEGGSYSNLLTGVSNDGGQVQIYDPVRGISSIPSSKLAHLMTSRIVRKHIYTYIYPHPY